jgi:hypothetical protein
VQSISHPNFLYFKYAITRIICFGHWANEKARKGEEKKVYDVPPIAIIPIFHLMGSQFFQIFIPFSKLMGKLRCHKHLELIQSKITFHVRKIMNF